MFVRGAELSEEQRGAQLCKERGGEMWFLYCPLHCGVTAGSGPFPWAPHGTLPVGEGLCSVPGQQSSAFPAMLSATQSVGVRMIWVSGAPGSSPRELSL